MTFRTVNERRHASRTLAADGRREVLHGMPSPPTGPRKLHGAAACHPVHSGTLCPPREPPSRAPLTSLSPACRLLDSAGRRCRRPQMPLWHSRRVGGVTLSVPTWLSRDGPTPSMYRDAASVTFGSCRMLNGRGRSPMMRSVGVARTTDALQTVPRWLGPEVKEMTIGGGHQSILTPHPLGKES